MVARSALLEVQTDEWGIMAFSHDHTMEHRYLLNGVPDHAIPPLPIQPLDPMPSDPLPVPADKWNMTHQAAHNDAFAGLPAFYGATIMGIRPGQILIESDIADEDQLKWWTFVNHIEHMVAMASIQAPFPLYFPRW